ncbi:nuclear transport factor 2 family protein [Streptomyces sp. NPDC093510]|uniref:nuclear transport factor 2 family protein n=1 Tax=Streptomyces sp. NPDC093510 TaxID=3155199 RepID=UPI00342EB044
MTNHKETLKQYAEYLQRGEREKLLALVTDDFVFEKKGQPALQGKQVLLAMIDNRDGIMHKDAGTQVPTHKIERIIEEGDTLAVSGTIQVPQPDGGQLELLFSDYVIFRGDLVSRIETYLIPAGAPQG